MFNIIMYIVLILLCNALILKKVPKIPQIPANIFLDKKENMISKKKTTTNKTLLKCSKKKKKNYE